MSDLIIIKQLPVIEEQLKLIRKQIQEKIDRALAMVCTEESVKQIKEIRAELTKDYQAFEEKRKEVKTKILTPYNCFEDVYKECVTQAFKPADQKLKVKIDEVEDGLKEIKKNEVVEYFNECAAAANIDFITFEQSGITVTLTASKKSLKERAKAFVDKVSDEMSLIDTQEHKAEILVEYKKTLNVASAITTVSARHRAIEEERENEKRRQNIAEANNLAKQRVDAAAEEEQMIFSPPTADPIGNKEDISPDESAPSQAQGAKLFQVTFTVTATREKLVELKEFLVNGGYDYESK